MARLQAARGVAGSQPRRQAATGARLARPGRGRLAGRAASAGRCPGPTGALAWRAAITGLVRARQLVVLAAAAATQPASLVARRPERRLGRRRRPLIRAGRF